MQRNKLSPIFILKKHPKEYLKQGFSHCGAYSVKGILSAFGKDTKNHPKEYHKNWISWITGAGFTKSYYVDMLQSQGFQAIGKNAQHLSDENKLNLLKKLLSKNMPVMLLIGNGYTKNGKFNFLRAQIVSHWITLWGFDDKKKIFYVYDSAVPKKLYDKNIPIGNKKRTYLEILRDWKGSLLPSIMMWGQYFYIQIDSSDKNE